MAIQLEEILAAIRQRESGNNYQAKAPKSSASGAYQFVDSTWQGLLKRYDLTGPSSARDATPQLQDYVAGRYIADILKSHGGDLRAVPAVWYTGKYDPSKLDYVPHPEAGNNLSVRAYVDHWLEALAEHSPGFEGAAGVVVSDTPDRPAAGGPTALDTFLNAALAQQGDRYVFGHEVRVDDADPDTFDCSELVQWAAMQAGVEITDGSWLQYRAMAQKGANLPVEEALRTPGALLFTFSSDPNTGGRPSRAHVAISLGDGRVMEARNPRVGVLISDASTHKWTHAATIPELGTEVSAGWPTSEELPTAPPEFGLDSDADSLLDEHELYIGTNPFAPDTDLDGFADAAELLADTDPLDAAHNVLALAGAGPVYIPPLSIGAPAKAGTEATPVPPLPEVNVSLPPNPVTTTEPSSTGQATAQAGSGTGSSSDQERLGGVGDDDSEPVAGDSGSVAGSDPTELSVDDEARWAELSDLARSNEDVAAQLQTWGVDGPEDLHLLPVEFVETYDL